MAGLSDLFGRNGVLEQLVLWNVAGQVISAAMGPSFTLLQQDMNARHPVQVLDPATAADLAARGIITAAAATSEAARSGLSAGRFHDLVEMHTVRLSPGDLATAVLRSYISEGEARAAAAPQGVTPAMLDVLVNLSGDAPGADQLAAALRRGIIPRNGQGAASTSFAQGIRETRLHDKWTPVIEALSAEILSPADAAAAVVRNFISQAEGVKIASQNGVAAAEFATLIHLSGDSPGPQQLAEALRRGLIPATGTGAATTSFQQGIAEGRLADKWAPVIEGLAKIWPTPVDALDAALKGQISDAEGKALYARLGGDLQFYPWLLATVGDSPTPLEAAVMAARGIIAEGGLGADVLSYAQAVKESRYRNKWANAYRQLAKHIPPPSTVTTLLSHRVIDADLAHTLLLENDMAPDLAAAYVAEAEYEAISDYRGLTESNVLDMYIAHLVNRDQATQMLSVLHVSAAAAALLLDQADMRYAMDSVNKSVQRIATLYTGRKIGTDTATAALATLGISTTAIDQIIQDWELQAAASVKILTESQIVDAWYYGIVSQDEAIADLAAVGYSPYDAWVVLSVKNKSPLPNPPPRVVAPPAATVIPGVT